MNILQPCKSRLSKMLCEMIAIPSINPYENTPEKGVREAEMADYLRTQFEDIGLEFGSHEVVPGRPNIWGKLEGGDGPSVMLAAHMDTVGIEDYPNGLVPIVDDDRVYGRGACDMKGAIASFLETIRLIRASGQTPAGDVIIACFADEEHAMIGSSVYGQMGPLADYVIVGEPTGLKVCPAHKGQLCVEFSTTGKATHSSGPENGVNAVEHMAQVIQHFATHNQDLQESGLKHPICGTGRFSMNVIRGGTSASAIPDTCVLEVDRRFLPGETPEQIMQEFSTRLDTLMTAQPDIKVALSAPTLLVHPLETPVGSPLVQTLLKNSHAVTELPAEVHAFPGGTDAPNLNCMSVICGPGHLEQAHSANEFVEISQLCMATEIYLRTIADLQTDQTRDV